MKYREGEGQDFDYHATDWVPSFSTSYKLNESDLLKLAYNLRIRRPDISRLNPYVLVDGSGMTYGYSGLMTEKHNRISFSYNHFTSRLSIQATALFTFGQDLIASYRFIDDRGIWNSTYSNVLDLRGGGFSGYANYMPFPNTSLSTNVMLYYLDLKAKKESPDIMKGLRTDGFSGSLYGEFSQRFKYHPEGSSSSNYYYYGFGIEKTFLKEKLTLAARFQNCFNPYVTYRVMEDYNDYTAVSTERTWNRAFGITVTYRFGDLKAAVKKAARSIRNDDLMQKEEER